MGEIAEMMLDGTLCESCGEFIGDGDGYPRKCGGCGGGGEYGSSARSVRHQRWYEENMKELKKSGLVFAERPTAMLFREAGKPKVDFYPHTGRWKVVGVPKPPPVQGGGAQKFIAWYKEQKA